MWGGGWCEEWAPGDTLLPSIGGAQQNPRVPRRPAAASSTSHNPISDSLWVWGTRSRPGRSVVCPQTQGAEGGRRTLCLLQCSFLEQQTSREECLIVGRRQVVGRPAAERKL